MNLKRILFFILLTSLVQLSAISSYSYSGQSMVGDVNGDNSVNSVDYAYMRQHLLGIIDDFPVSDDLWAADVNGDDKFNSIDFGYLRSYLLGLIDKLPKNSFTPTPTPSKETPTRPAVTPTPSNTEPIPSTSGYPDWKKERSSYATFTGSGYSGGAALLDPIPSDMEITALNPEDYNSYGINAALAGAYLEVTGAKGSTIVYVTDLYPEGAPGALDLCPTSFGKLDDMEKGKINIKWHVVAAPVTGNVSYRIKEGSTKSWLAVQVRNPRYPVLKMECYKDGKWINMVKMPWNHFVIENLDTTTPKIRMTDIRGYVLTDTIDSIPESGDTRPAYILDGNVQFPE